MNTLSDCSGVAVEELRGIPYVWRERRSETDFPTREEFLTIAPAAVAAEALLPELATGSMGPKLEAALAFARATGREALITSAASLAKALAELDAADSLGNGRHLFTGSLVINRSGAFGYTVRVFPKHPALASKAELGLIVNA